MKYREERHKYIMTNSKRKFELNNLARLRTEKVLAAAAICCFLIFRFIIGIATVRGNSMSPTLENGQIVLCYHLQKNYNRGDIVSVRMTDGEYLVKRVVAVAGDEVDIRGGTVFVNGKREDGDYCHSETEAVKNAIHYPLTIDEGMIFLLGDNRETSVDSRTYGPFSITQTRGKVLMPKR